MNNKLIALTLAVIFAAAAFCGCSHKNGRDASVVTVAPVTAEPVITAVPAVTAVPTEASSRETAAPTDAPTVAPTSAPTEAPTNAPTSAPTSAPTNVPTSAPTAAPTQASSGELDFNVFSGCAFIGNSTFEGLYAYGIITTGKFFTKVGLNINTVYTEHMPNSNVAIIDELNTGTYRGVLVMLGQNECGWPSLDTFITKYGKLINDIRQRQPNCKVFIMGIPPVTKAVSDKGANGVTNEHINYINNGLKQLAASTSFAYFVTVPSAFYGSDNALPAEASSDGIHLNLTYSRMWANHICRTVMDVLG